jgi:hypothetical protein
MIAGCAALLLALAAPQQPDGECERLANGLRLRAVAVPGSGHVGVTLLWRVGADHDPRGGCGVAAAVAEVLQLAQEPAPQALRLRVEMHGSFTVAQAVVPAGSAGELRARVVDLAGGRIAIDDDTAARAIAIAALAADDASRLLPGPMLLQRARRALLAGTPRARPASGLVADLKQLRPAALLARIGDQYHAAQAIVVLLGALPPDEVAAWRDALGALPAGAGRAEPQLHDDAAASDPITTFPMTDAPYVSFAYRLPDAEPERIAAWVATAMLQARAASVIGRPRRAELQARFPFLHFHPLAADPLVLVNRRGRNHEPIEGPQQEIEDLLQGFMRGIRASEVAAAAEQVARAFRLPPFPPATEQELARQPALLPGRGLAIALAVLYERPPDLATRIAEVPVPAVQQALGAMLAPDRRAWFALVPAAGR